MNFTRMKVFICLSLLLAFFVPNVSVFASQISVLQSSSLEQMRQEIFVLANKERENLGLSELRENPSLNMAAQIKAESMARLGYFSHIGPNGESPWAVFNAVGYRYKQAGENIAMRFTTASSTVRAWMNSPSHRENILRTTFEESGMGIAVSNLYGKNVIFVVQLFAKPIAYR